MTNFGVTEERKRELRRRMRRKGIFEKDITETFVKSSGPGGQNVNKVSTCVFLKHNPSGISVKCQTERTQALNRFKARNLLVSKIQAARRQVVQKEIDIVQKNKRRNRKRTTVAKEEMLRQKKMKSERKQSRKKININKLDDY